MFGPDLIKESERKVKLIHDRLKVAQSRQKSYADSKRKETIYEVGDRVYLHVSPIRGVKRFELRESKHHVLWDHTKFWNLWDKLLTSWNYPKDCQEFTTCSMFPS